MPDNRCRACHGRGGHIERDIAGEYIVTCPGCLERGICPRCASSFDVEDLYPLEAFICVACGWVVQAGRMQTRDAEPQPPICEACDGTGGIWTGGSYLSEEKCPVCGGAGIVKP